MFQDILRPIDDIKLVKEKHEITWRTQDRNFIFQRNKMKAINFKWIVITYAQNKTEKLCIDLSGNTLQECQNKIEKYLQTYNIDYNLSDLQLKRSTSQIFRIDNLGQNGSICGHSKFWRVILPIEDERLSLFNGKLSTKTNDNHNP